MKKIFSFVAVSAMVALVSCGPSAEEIAKQKADSTAKADSIAAAEAHVAWVADSTHDADSAKAAHDAWVADSTHDADSAAAAKPKSGGGGPKPPKGPTQPTIKPNGGGRPGANK